MQRCRNIVGLSHPPSPFIFFLSAVIMETDATQGKCRRYGQYLRKNEPLKNMPKTTKLRMKKNAAIGKFCSRYLCFCKNKNIILTENEKSLNLPSTASAVKSVAEIDYTEQPTSIDNESRSSDNPDIQCSNCIEMSEQLVDESLIMEHSDREALGIDEMDLENCVEERGVNELDIIEDVDNAIQKYPLTMNQILQVVWILHCIKVHLLLYMLHYS